jgi:hypothetical protein
MTMRITRQALALGVLLVAALSGCSAQGGDGVATAGGQNSSSNSAGAGQLSDQEQAVKYAQCLRDQGIEVKDPEDGKPPAIEPGVATDQEVQAAEEACRKYAPGGGGQVRKLDPEQLENLRQVAQCMRDHGYPTFPDPDPDKGGIVLGDDSGIDQKDPKFAEASRECGMDGTPTGDGEMSAEGDG